MTLGVDKINTILESFMGINDTELGKLVVFYIIFNKNFVNRNCI